MTSIAHERDVYCTGDMALAATICLWYPLDAIERRAGGPVFFVFRRVADLDILLEDYWRGVIRVEPQAYCEQVSILQRRVQERSVTS